MKQRIVFFVIVSFIFLSEICHAQDIIVKNTGEEIEAKVLEVTGSHVKYKDYYNPGGPTKNIYTGDIFVIMYQDGSQQIFNLEEEEEPEDDLNMKIKKKKRIWFRKWKQKKAEKG